MKPVSLSDYVIALLELLEAEGRELKQQSVKLGYSLGLISLGFILALIAFGFLLWAIYGLLSQNMSPEYAALTMSGIALLLAFILFGASRWMRR